MQKSHHYAKKSSFSLIKLLTAIAGGSVLVLVIILVLVVRTAFSKESPKNAVLPETDMSIASTSGTQSPPPTKAEAVTVKTTEETTAPTPEPYTGYVASAIWEWRFPTL